MSGGKFSKPRTHQREDREIDLAFRQVTAPAKPAEAAPETPEQESSAIRRNRKIIAIALCAVGVVLLIGIAIGVSFMLRPAADNGLILNNVTAAGVNIGGMTPEQAQQALHRATDLTYSQEDMVLVLPDGELRLSPAKTGAKLDIEALVQAAYDYGRTGTDAQNKQAYEHSLTGAYTLAALPFLQLDREYIKEALADHFADFSTDYTPMTYVVEGEMPELDGEKFDEKAPCQVLVFHTGTPGKHIDLNKIYNQVLDAYSFNTFRVEISYGEEDEGPALPDLDAILKELHKDPVDAEMNMETFKVSSEIYGYTFDAEKAKSMLELAGYDVEIRISMEYIVPEVLKEDLEELLFRDVLGSYETSTTKDADRNANLKLACKAINNLVLKPGETFSFNTAVGKPTEAAGYKHAVPFAGGEDEEVLGGGICQVASTLYCSALLGDLRITERDANTYAPDYIGKGLDVAIVWKGADLQFMNNTTYPIRIEAQVSGSKVIVKLLGTDEKDYFVRLDSSVTLTNKPTTEYEELEEDNEDGYKDGDVIREGVQGSKVTTYLCKYSKETGEQVTRDQADVSNYRTLNRLVAKVLPKETDPPETTEEPTEPSDPTESTESTESTENTEASETIGTTEGTDPTGTETTP